MRQPPRPSPSACPASYATRTLCLYGHIASLSSCTCVHAYMSACAPYLCRAQCASTRSCHHPPHIHPRCQHLGICQQADSAGLGPACYEWGWPVGHLGSRRRPQPLPKRYMRLHAFMEDPWRHMQRNWHAKNRPAATNKEPVATETLCCQSTIHLTVVLQTCMCSEGKLLASAHCPQQGLCSAVTGCQSQH